MLDVTNIDTPVRSLSLLHPEFSGPCIALAQYLVREHQAGRAQSLFKPFESIRLADRQNYLFLKGRSKARGWQSAHQFGLACDFAAIDEIGEWSWSDTHDWTFLRLAAERHQLTVPIPWDKGHVQSPKWRLIKDRVMA